MPAEPNVQGWTRHSAVVLSTQPLSVPDNERAHLLALAQQRWPDEVAWGALVLPDEDASAVSSQGHAAMLAIMLDRATSPRQWDATVAQLSQRLPAQAMLTLLEQSGRTDALAMVWQATWYQALDRRADAFAAIERAAKLQPRLPRVLQMMGELAPASAALDTVWPGALER